MDYIGNDLVPQEMTLRKVQEKSILCHKDIVAVQDLKGDWRHPQ